MAKKTCDRVYNKHMISNTSLLNKIPLPTQTQQTPVVPASVRVGEVSAKEGSESAVVKNENPSFVERIKTRILEKRIKSIENKPPEKRSETEQAELEANKTALNYMV